jgi:ABC-type multidrug transport system permease subunit
MCTLSAAHVMTTALVVRMPDIASEDQMFGTLWRLRLGSLSVFATILARSWVYVVEAVTSFAGAVVIVAPVLGHAQLLPQLAAALPAVLVVALATGSVGLVVTAAALGARSAVLLSNAAAYTCLAFGGTLSADVGPPWMQLVGVALPTQHALTLLRRTVDGSWTWGDVAVTAASSAALVAVAAVIVHVQLRRARTLGRDEFV